MPSQSCDQACALCAVETLEVALQVIACIAAGARASKSQPHIYQRTKNILSEVTCHGARRNVPAFFCAVWVVELDQQSPVMTFGVTGASEDFQWRANWTRFAIFAGIKNTFVSQAKAAG